MTITITEITAARKGLPLFLLYMVSDEPYLARFLLMISAEPAVRRPAVTAIAGKASPVLGEFVLAAGAVVAAAVVAA